MNNKTLVDDILKTQADYYTKYTKQVFFKSTQKNNCAKNVADNFSLDELISRTVFLIPNTNSIYIDYIIFKSFANTDNYGEIIERLIGLIKTVIYEFGHFEIHLGLKSFSATAMERYSKVFELYYAKCCKHGLYYKDEIISKINIYHTPSVITMLSKIIVKYTEPSIKKKIIYHSNEESDKRIKELME
jgi:5'(3')-deoxyribonucleotidase